MAHRISSKPATAHTPIPDQNQGALVPKGLQRLFHYPMGSPGRQSCNHEDGPADDRHDVTDRRSPYQIQNGKSNASAPRTIATMNHRRVLHQAR